MKQKIPLFSLVLIVAVLFIYGYIQRQSNQRLLLHLDKKNKALDECGILFQKDHDAFLNEIGNLHQQIDSLKKANKNINSLQEHI